MTDHKTYVVDGKVVHYHEFPDGSTMVTGVDEVINHEEKASNEPVSLSGVGKTVAIPYILSCILVSLPCLVVIGAFIYAFISVVILKK